MTDASDSSQPSGLVTTNTQDPPPQSESLLPDIFARLARIETLFVNHVEGIAPRLTALEQGLEKLAHAAASGVSADLLSEIEHLKSLVASIGGAQFGHRGNDGGGLFHTWWAELTGHLTPGAVSKKS